IDPPEADKITGHSFPCKPRDQWAGSTISSTGSPNGPIGGSGKHDSRPLLAEARANARLVTRVDKQASIIALEPPGAIERMKPSNGFHGEIAGKNIPMVPPPLGTQLLVKPLDRRGVRRAL